MEEEFRVQVICMNTVHVNKADTLLYKHINIERSYLIACNVFTCGSYTSNLVSYVLTPKLQASRCSSRSLVAPTCRTVLSEATCRNKWCLRFLSRLPTALRAPGSEWWFTRRPK